MKPQHHNGHGGQAVLGAIDQVLLAAAHFALGVMVAREGGVVALGQFAFAYSLIVLTSMLHAAAIAEIYSVAPDVPGAIRRYGSVPIALVTLALAVLAALIVGAASLFSRDIHDSAWTPSFLCALVSSTCYWSVKPFFYRQHRPRTVIGTTAVYAAVLLGSAYVGYRWQGASWQPLMSIAFAATVASAPLWRAMKWPTRDSATHLKHYLTRTLNYAAWGVPAAVLIWINSNGYMFVMPLYGDTAQTGGLRAVLNLVAPINTLLVGACTAWLPMLAELHRGQDKHVYAQKIHRVAIGIFAITLAGGLLLMPLSKWLIGFIYGDAYRSFANVLRAAALLPALWVVASIYRAAIRAQANTRDLFKIYAMALMPVGVVLMAVLSRLGAVAAIRGMLITQVLVVAGFVYYFGKQVRQPRQERKAFTFATANTAKLVRLPLYAMAGVIALMFPRDRTLWVFGRKTGVGEGPLRLLQVTRKHHPRRRLVWIAQDQTQYDEAHALGIEVHLKSTWQARWLTLRAGVGVVTHGFGDLCRPFVPGIYLVQLWHGAPLKRIHLDAPNAQLTGARGVWGRLGAWLVATMFKASARMISCLPSPSAAVSERFKTAWGWSDTRRIHLTGDPRCDVLLDGDPASRTDQARRLLAACWQTTTLPTRLVIFAPTWRDGEADPTLPCADVLRQLEEVLASQDAWLVVRSHPWGTMQDANVDRSATRIRFLSTSMLHDVNRVLNAFDALITDYSAIAIDYSLLQRPIIFFAPDLEAYQRSRGLYEHYDDYTGGEWFADWPGVTNKLAQLVGEPAIGTCAAQDVPIRLASRYHDHADANSAERLLRVIDTEQGLAIAHAPDAPIHVLHVSGCLGGVETYLQLLATHADNNRMKQSFVLPEPCALSRYADTQGMAVHIVPMKRRIAPWADFKAALALRRIIRRISPDIVHLHSSKAGLVGRLGCLGLNCRIIYTPHAYFYLAKKGFARRVFLWAERFLGWLTRCNTLGTSPSEQRRALEDIGCPRQRVDHILNSVDVEQLIERRRDKRGRHVLLVARISAQKNIAMYLDVVRRLRQSAKVPCYLVGVGHYPADRRRLAAMMKTAGVNEVDLRIVPWMPREDLIELLASAAVVVLTSAYESFGYVLAEANALGVPVVGTHVDGIGDIIRHGHNGYLVEPGNAAAMAAYIEMLLADDDNWAAMSVAARDEAAARFDIRRAIPQFEAFYARHARDR